jgi:hypothetical protein
MLPIPTLSSRPYQGAILVAAGLIWLLLQYNSDWVTSKCLSLVNLGLFSIQTHYVGLELIMMGLVLELVGVWGPKILGSRS